MKKFLLALLFALLFVAPQPADAAWTKKGECAGQSSGGTINCTLNGASNDSSLIVVTVVGTFCDVSSAGTVTDGASDTYSLIDAVGTAEATWYVQGASLSSNIQVNLVGCFGGNILAVAFTVAASTPLDGHTSTNSGASPTTTVNTGSITPTTNGDLIYASVVSITTDDTTQAIDSSLTVLTSVSHGGSSTGSIAAAWKEQVTAGAINPQWTIASTNFPKAFIAAFKASGGGGGSPPCTRSLLGVGCLE